MSDQLPRLDPEALKSERHDADLGSEADNEGHDHVGRDPGRAPGGGDDASSQPTGGAIPPAR